MTYFPSSPNTGDTFWKGESLYKYSDSTWNKTMDLTPLHHWRLNDIDNGTLTVSSDSGTNPIAGVITDCVLSQTGKISRCMAFAGTTSSINIAGVGDALSNSVVTINYWLKLDGVQETELGSIFNAGEFYMAANSTGAGIFQLSYFSGSAITLSDLSQSAWNHISLIKYQAATGTLYKNGIYMTSAAVASNPVASGALYLGNNSAGDRALYGSLEDVRIYDRALTQQEIQAIYDKGRGTYSHSLVKGYPTVKPPIHHWKLQENTGTTACDSGSSPIAGINSGALINRLGQIGNSYQFTGTASYIDGGATSAPSGTCAFALWARLSALGSMTVYDCNSLSCAFTINHTDSEGKIRIYTAEANYRTYNNTKLAVDTWYHLANTWDAATMSLYINSSLVTAILSTTGTLQSPTNGTVFIGSNSGTANFFNGYIEDVRIYDYSLSPQEITNLYNLGKGTHL